MRIAEIYVSIQGEGVYAGEPTVFVRLTGCNLRCWYCDSRHTSWNPEGVQRTWESVAEEILAFDVPHVDITGGEPLLQPDVVPLSVAIRNAGRFVTIETAATVDRPIQADLLSISPKRPNSMPADSRWARRHESVREAPAIIRRWLADYHCQFKFVIDTPADLVDLLGYHRQFPTIRADQIWLMPQAVDPGELQQKSVWIREEAIRLGYRFSPRLHIERFGNARGK